MKEKEIEFKNLLNETEYQYIFNHFVLNEVETINNYNYYYDYNEQLKHSNAILRIRQTDKKCELTLKVIKNNYNLEINIPIERASIPKEIKFSSLHKDIKDELLKMGVTSKYFELFQKTETLRKEKTIDYGLLVLDKTTFINNITDYELEFEVADYEKGKTEFNNILKNLNIEKRKALPKIARAELYLKNINYTKRRIL